MPIKYTSQDEVLIVPDLPSLVLQCSSTLRRPAQSYIYIPVEPLELTWSGEIEIRTGVMVPVEPLELTWSGEVGIYVYKYLTVFTGLRDYTNCTLSTLRTKLVQHPTNPLIWWVLIAERDDQLWSTADGGATWTRLTDSEPDPHNSIYAATIKRYLNYHAVLFADPVTADVFAAYPDGFPSEM